MIYDNLSYDMLAKLFASTDSTYHAKVTELYIEMVDATFLEKHRGRAEPFKNKILFKASYLISLMVKLSDHETCNIVFRKLLKALNDQSLDMCFLIFSALDSKVIKPFVCSDPSTEKLVGEIF